MKGIVEFPIRHVIRPHYREDVGPWNEYQRERITPDDASLAFDLVRRTIYHCMRDGCDRPAFILCGWRTYLGLSHALSGAEFTLATEIDGIPIVCDPSRASFVQAIEHRRHIGCSKGPFVTEYGS